MKPVLIAFVSLLASILFPCCDYVEALYRDGNYIETDEWIEEFTGIKVETPVQLILEQTHEQIAHISGLDFMVRNLTFTVENKVLVIESKGYDYSRKDQLIIVHLPVKALNKITLDAPTQLDFANELSLDNLHLVINGQGTYSESRLKLNCRSVSIAAYGANSGTHILEGATDNLSLTMEGLAWVDASMMMASKVTVNQRSLKSSYVLATDQLIVNMYSSGHVYFTGQPRLEYQTYDPGWEVEFGRGINQSE